MQDPQMEWQVCYEIPWQLRYLILYLLIALGVFLVKSVRLGRHLWWFSLQRRASPAKPGDDLAEADHLAASALANRKWVGSSQHSVSARQLQLAEIKFRYRWEACSAEVGSVRRLIILTALLSTTAMLLLTSSWLRTIAIQKSMSVCGVAAGLVQAFAPLVYGSFFCSVFFLGFHLYQGMLARRRAAWNYLCARLRTEATTPIDTNAIR